MSGRLLMRMETALSLNSLRRVSLYASNHRRSKPRKDLALQLDRPANSTIVADADGYTKRRFRASFEHRRANLMADRQAANTADQALQDPEGKKEKGASEAEKPSPPPPPPEKPLPGDCCGSGCVRCVWDVYYEELEEYNKLYKSDSGPNPKPSS